MYLAWMALAATFLTYCNEETYEIVVTYFFYILQMQLYLLVTGLDVETEEISLAGVAL